MANTSRNPCILALSHLSARTEREGNKCGFPMVIFSRRNVSYRQSWMFTEASIRAKVGYAQPATAAALARFLVRDSTRLGGHIHKMALPVQKYRGSCRWARCRNMYTFHVLQPHTTAREL
jgi:hypothetical protein